MRGTLLAGAVLTVASILLITLSASLGLDVESVALMGAGSGAVLALVPHRSAPSRLIGFLVGFVISWLGYLVRAGFLPDTAWGHALAVGLVVVLCTVAVVVSRERLALWSTLLGAAVLAGSYETTYIEAPSQVLSTSWSTSTSVLLAFALGFFAAALVASETIAPRGEAVPAGDETPPSSPEPAAAEPEKVAKGAGDTRLGAMMKEDAR
jgi:hypothetical protein